MNSFTRLVDNVLYQVNKHIQELSVSNYVFFEKKACK